MTAGSRFPVSSVDRTRAYTTTLQPLPGNKARVPVPFDPNTAWGTKRSTT